MNEWKLLEAKNTLSQAPQPVTRRNDRVLVVRETDYQQRPNFIKYLMDGPSFESVDLERYPSLMRNMDL